MISRGNRRGLTLIPERIKRHDEETDHIQIFGRCTLSAAVICFSSGAMAQSATPQAATPDAAQTSAPAITDEIIVTSQNGSPRSIVTSSRSQHSVLRTHS